MLKYMGGRFMITRKIIILIILIVFGVEKGCSHFFMGAVHYISSIATMKNVVYDKLWKDKIYDLIQRK